MNTEIIYFKCGKILKTHGVKGELKVKPLTDFDRFTSGNKLYINHQDSYIEVTVDTVRDFGEDLLVTFKDYMILIWLKNIMEMKYLFIRTIEKNLMKAITIMNL